MALRISVSGEASASCDRCGWIDYWDWDEDEGPQAPNLPTPCPNCDDAPFLLRWRRRIRYEWREWWRRRRAPEFLSTVWASDVQDAIEFEGVLSKLVGDDPNMKVGKTINIPSIDSLAAQITKDAHTYEEVLKREDCNHAWEDLPQESSLVEHDQVCPLCGAERDLP